MDTLFDHSATIVVPMLFESMLAIGAVLLIGSGGAKLFDRAPTRGALAAAGLPASDSTVVALALVELAAGLSALTLSSPLGVLAVSALYLGFSGFVAYALGRRIPIQSCGCFGKVDTPPDATHLVVNLTLAVSALGALTQPRLVDRLIETPGPGIGFAVMAVIGSYLTYLMLAEWPATLRAMRGST